MDRIALLIVGGVASAAASSRVTFGVVSWWNGRTRGAAAHDADDEARRLAEETLRAFVEFGPDAVLITDAEGLIVSVNAQTERMFGFGREELVGSAVELLLPDRYARAHEGHRRAFAAAPHARPMGAGGTLYGRRKNGAEFAVDISLSPMPTADGTLFAAAIRDASDRVAAADALRESETRLQAILDHSPAFIYMKDLEGRYVFVNRTYERLFHVDRAEFIGKTDIDLVDAETAAGRRGRDRHVIETGEPRIGEFATVLDDGVEHTWVSVKFPLKDVSGVVYAICGIYTDITDRKVAEEALQASETRFRVLSDSAFEGILIRDGARILDSNRALASMFGYEREEVVDLDWRKLLIPADVGTVSRYVEHGGGEAIEVTGVRKDGSTMVLLGRGVDLPYQGREARVVALQDISDLKEAERELLHALRVEQEASERLHELDRIKDTFLQAVSHDLRTPLAVIVWLAEALSQGRSDLSPDDVAECLRRIVVHAKDLDRLVLDLLDLDRLSVEDAQLTLTPTDVGALVADAVARSTALANHVVHVDASSIVAPVDPVLILRMVENLLINSAKHTPEGTDVWVSVRREPDGALVSVDDAGPGVPEQMRETIFEPFQQGSHGRRNASGLGIGLSLVARFADLHGGRAWVEDRAGRGASFRFLIPLEAAEVEARS